MDKISALYDNYSDIVEEFGGEVIQQRFQDLFAAYKEFIDDQALEKLVRIDKHVLMNTVLDYFTDMSRLKKNS